VLSKGVIGKKHGRRTETKLSSQRNRLQGSGERLLSGSWPCGRVTESKRARHAQHLSTKRSLFWRTTRPPLLSREKPTEVAGHSRPSCDGRRAVIDEIQLGGEAEKGQTEDTMRSGGLGGDSEQELF